MKTASMQATGILGASEERAATVFSAAMSGGLELQCLGRLELRRDGEALPLPRSRKTRALLGYLALTDRRYSRDRLVSLFWSVPDDPRGALRWSLSKLRIALDEPDRRRVLADRDTVALDLSDADVDVIRLRDLVDGGLDDAPTEALLAAVEAFEGELFAGLDLPDSHEFQFWLVSARESAAGIRAKLDRELLRRFADDPARGLPHARALVDFDPYDQEAQGALIAALWRLGETARAEAQYRQILREMEHEGVDAGVLRNAWNERNARRTAAAPTAASDTPEAASPAAPEEAAVVAELAAAEEAASILRRPAVAVLPFDDMSGDPDKAYFADGITEEIITALSQWRWFPVIARTSTFAYRGRNLPVEDVGRQLGARYVVQGSVRRAGARVRVVAQLIDAESGLSIWGQRYDREISDIFELQDDIATQIVVEIEPEVARAERKRAERRKPESLDVWDLNLRALASIDRGGPRDLQRALETLDRSLEIEPQSSYTHALRAYALYNRSLINWTDDPVSAAARVMDAARQAVELDDRNWLGHALLGISTMWRLRDYDGASAAEERALALNPTAPLAHQFLGCVRNFDGRPAEALPHLASSLKLNPGPSSATLLLADMSLSHLLVGDLDQSVSYARRAISRYWGNTRAWERLAAALGLQGRTAEAAEAFQQIVGRGGMPGPEYFTTTYPFRTDEHRERLLGGLSEAGLQL